MLVLTQKEIEKLLLLKEIKKAVDVVEEAFFDHGRGRIQMPPKVYLDFKRFLSVLLNLQIEAVLYIRFASSTKRIKHDYSVNYR